MAEQNTPAPADMAEAVALPCPYCGGPAKKITCMGERNWDAKAPPYYHPQRIRYVCAALYEEPIRDCPSRLIFEAEQEEAAISAWNTRAITAMQAYMASDGVTQMDRDAAAKLLGGAAPDGLVEGRKDSLSLVQDFAAHRRAATITTQPDPRDAEIERLRLDVEKEQALQDSAYRAGLKAGWNMCVNDDHDGYAKATESTEHIAELRRIREARAALAKSEGRTNG